MSNAHQAVTDRHRVELRGFRSRNREIEAVLQVRGGHERSARERSASRSNGRSTREIRGAISVAEVSLRTEMDTADKEMQDSNTLSPTCAPLLLVVLVRTVSRPSVALR